MSNTNILNFLVPIVIFRPIVTELNLSLDALGFYVKSVTYQLDIRDIKSVACKLLVTTSQAKALISELHCAFSNATSSAFSLDDLANLILGVRK